MRTPQCLANHIDVAGDRFVLLLEDVGARTMVSQVVGLDVTRAAESVRAIARLHAHFWASPQLESLAWMPRAIDPEVAGAGHSYRQAWPVFRERFSDSLPDGAEELAMRVGATWEAMAQETYDDSPRTVCHGDFRADNLMFDDTATGADHVAVLDWQISYRGAGIGDIGYLLVQSMTADARCAHERELVEQWYDELASSLGTAPAALELDSASLLPSI